MLTVNIALVILGVTIPIGIVIFWSRAKKLLESNFETQSYSGTTLNGSHLYNLIEWMYSHRSLFNTFVAAIVTIIEFLALLPF